MIDMLEVPTTAFLQPGCMVKTKGVLVEALAAAVLGSTTAVVGAIPAAEVTTTLPVVALAARVMPTERGVGPRTVSQVRAIAAGFAVNPTVACRAPVEKASASTASGSFEKSIRDMRLYSFFFVTRALVLGHITHIGGSEVSGEVLGN
jgi:hypothetical protein